MLGAVAAVAGYFTRIREICDEYGVFNGPERPESFTKAVGLYLLSVLSLAPDWCYSI